MSYVYVSSFVVPSVRRDKRQSASSGSFAFGGTETTIVNNTTVTTAAPKTQISFIDDAVPTIANYAMLWASTYGQLPTARLWIYQTETGNFKEVDLRPEMVMIDNLIDSIKFDIGTPQTGFIILS